MEPELKAYFDKIIQDSKTKLLSYTDVILAQQDLICAMDESLAMEGISDDAREYVFSECKKILKQLFEKEDESK